MLSRIAQSLFWIGRYLERADDTARILDVQMQVLIEDPGMDERTSCEQLLSVMGVEDHSGTPNRWMILGPAHPRARDRASWPRRSDDRSEHGSMRLIP